MMEIAFTDFVEQCKQQNNQSLTLFLTQAEYFLAEQLKDYLGVDAQNLYNFSTLLAKAKQTQHPETDNKFWLALLALHKTNLQGNKKNRQSWLKFVNIIEELQGYSGAQLIDEKSIKLKRVQRLYLAYMLSWEHLRYMAGKDDEYSPSAEIISCYSSAHSEDDHH